MCVRVGTRAREYVCARVHMCECVIREVLLDFHFQSSKSNKRNYFSLVGFYLFRSVS